MFDKKLFGERVRYFRNERNLTVEKLSELIDVDPSYITHIEKGKNTPTLPIIVALLNSLNVSYGSLMSGCDIDKTTTSAILAYLSTLDDKEVKLVTQILIDLKSYHA